MDSKGVRISVVVPVYNVEACIADTCKSLLAQTVRNFEVIFVDDGSKDRSAEVAQEVMAQGDVPYRIMHQENGGQGSARNAGFLQAQGEWLFFLDADDTIQPFSFALFEKIAQTYTDADMVYTGFQYVHGSDVFREAEASARCVLRTREQMLHGFLLRSIVPLVPGTFYHRDFLQKNNILHRHIRWSEDQHFMWQVLNKVQTAVQWDCVVYNYVRHEGTVMNSTPIARMKDAYGAFCELAQDMEDGEVRRYMVARWAFGCLRSTAWRENFAQWKVLFDSLEGKKQIACLRTFADIKVRLLAYLGSCSLRMLYVVLRGRGS